MKIAKLILSFLTTALFAPPALAHPAGATSVETLLLVPAKGSALVIINNASRFDPFVQRLLVEGEIKRWFVLDQPLMQIPPIQREGSLNELPIRRLDEFMHW